MPSVTMDQTAGHQPSDRPEQHKAVARCELQCRLVATVEHRAIWKLLRTVNFRFYFEAHWEEFGINKLIELEHYIL